MNHQETPQDRAIASFRRIFSASPDIAARAPGRVNIIGEHTDYNDGYVLPAALSVHTVVVGRKRSDRLVHVVAADFGDVCDGFELDTPIEQLEGTHWQNHVRGMVSEMDSLNPGVRGFDLAIAGNIPKGAGLSSSASVAVAVGTAICSLNDFPADPITIARLAQASEHNFVGTQCGIMDQLASACGQDQHGLLIDCRGVTIRPVRVPDDMAILIVQSGVVRQLSQARYNERRRECVAAAAALGLSSLREAILDQLEVLRNGEDRTLHDRARHVISENQRTLAAAEALEAGDFEWLGSLMAASHQSLRDDFVVSNGYVDRLVAIAQDAIGTEGGARMTGGGFGGAIVALVKNHRLIDVMERIAGTYRDPLGRPPSMMVERAAKGAMASAISIV
jgi:galactokinase